MVKQALNLPTVGAVGEIFEATYTPQEKTPAANRRAWVTWDHATGVKITV